MHHSVWSYAPIPECLCWRSKDDGGQQFRCVRASLETLSLRGSRRGRHHNSPPGLLLQVRLMEDREMQSACVCRDSAAPLVSMCMSTQQPCALWESQCALHSSPADFSSRWCPRRAVPEEVNPLRGMLGRTCRRSSVSWVSLCACRLQ